MELKAATPVSITHQAHAMENHAATATRITRCSTAIKAWQREEKKMESKISVKSNIIPHMIGHFVCWVDDMNFIACISGKEILCHKDFWSKTQSRRTENA